MSESAKGFSYSPRRFASNEYSHVISNIRAYAAVEMLFQLPVVDSAQGIVYCLTKQSHRSPVR
jgi:hypothetical protein